MSLASIASYVGSSLVGLGQAALNASPTTQAVALGGTLLTLAAGYFISNREQAQPMTERQVQVSAPSKAEQAEAAVEKALEGVADGITVYDLDKLVEAKPVKEKIKGFNLELRKIEALKIHLEGLADTHRADPEMTDAIRKKGVALNEQYRRVSTQKLQYVKQNVRSENQVYALVNPRMLPAGLEVYTANRSEKVLNILFNHGFQRYTVGNTLPATDYAGGFKDDVMEMGNVGRYFSVGSPAYLDETKLAIKCQTTKPQLGAAIMSVSELRRVGGFSADQIEQGYKRIQNDFPFLQNDGLPPKDTEVVYLRPEGSLQPVELLEGSWFEDFPVAHAGGMPLSWKGSIQDYFDRSKGGQKAPAFHSSWTTMPVPQQQQPALRASCGSGNVGSQVANSQLVTVKV